MLTEFHGTGLPNRSPVASSAMVHGTDQLVSASTTSGHGVLGWQEEGSTPSITEATHMEFLCTAYRKYFSETIVESILRAQRSSSVKQYEFCWRRF